MQSVGGSTQLYVDDDVVSSSVVGLAPNVVLLVRVTCAGPTTVVVYGSSILDSHCGSLRLLWWRMVGYLLFVKFLKRLLLILL